MMIEIDNEIHENLFDHYLTILKYLKKLNATYANVWAFYKFYWCDL